MPRQRSSGGDPARTLALLWRASMEPRPTRGPKQGRSVDAVVDTAVALADTEGLDAVSMRRIAQSLGVAPMSVYTYVPGKAELIDLMIDRVYASMPQGEHAGKPWRERLEAIARENLAMFEQHPWVVDVAVVRPPPGPGIIGRYEYELAALEGLGLDDVEMDAALTFLLNFVRAAAQAAIDVRRSQGESGRADRTWWEATAPLLARVMDASDYPLASRVGTAAGTAYDGAYDPRHAFEFGLRRVLDGLGALVGER
jgi:AcrR family transcriptional regulator